MKKMNLFYLVGLVIILIGTYVAYIGSSRDSDKTIQNLKISLNKKSEELQQKQASLEKKQDENNLLQEKILNFQKILDSNTKSITEVTKAISKVTTKTNLISNIIKDEQRVRGKVEFISNKYDYYNINLGMVGGLMKRSNIDNEETFYINDTPFSMLITGDRFLVSFKLKDKYGNLILDINKGEWAINKNDIFSLNYDSSGIEVIDKKGNIIIQIELIKNSFEIIGIFHEKNGVTLTHPGLLAKILYTDIQYEMGLIEFQLNIKRKFVHYGENYLGKRLSGM